MKNFFYTLFSLFIFICSFSSFSSESQERPKRILILQSYEPSFKWTSDIQNGIVDKFNQDNVPVRISVEFLDTKRISTPEYYQSFSQYFKIKYDHYTFDGIIIVDDNALTFFKNYSKPLTLTAPYVAVGINDLNVDLSSVNNKGIIIYEKDDVNKNINAIVKLNPSIKNLYFLSDRSTTSELVRKRVITSLSNFSKLNVIEIRDKTLREAAQQLSTISKDDAVLLSHYNTEISRGIYHSYPGVAETISQASRAPVFVLGEYFILSDVVGGIVLRPHNIGLKAAETLLTITSNIEHSQSKEVEVNLPVYNYSALKKHSIPTSLLPDNSVILNKPTSFIEEHLEILLISSAIIIILVVIIFIQSMTIRHKRRINNQHKKIVTLQKKTLSIQKDMINVLGEAIETRSGETGQHVKRVAKLSALMAKLLGLSHRECEMLEIISPMHDVGKIAIPESILDKPGKLTPSEWEIMQTHTTAGYKLLKSSNSDLTNIAAIIAYEHHERWDGKGYPNQKSAEEIHLFARITSIVDVFDALLSLRCYKEPWPIEDAVALFKRERGHQFDPQLIDIMLDNLKDFIQIRDCYPDKQPD
jgi:HD-GYP domain-containing protein (c-di-GMP phosphodiesterase class II)